MSDIMTTVRIKIADGEFVNLTFDRTDHKWKTLLQVPSETSYYQPDHKYGLIFEAWDKYGNNFIADRTDETFGDDLQVRVREGQTPAIVFTGPSRVEVSELHVAFDATDLGGSQLDQESIRIIFGVQEFDIHSQYVTKTDLPNGVHISFDPDYFLQDDIYIITVQAKDFDDNLTIEHFVYEVDTDPCEFILDRTQEDVDFVKELRTKYLNGTITEEEKEIFASDLKGARNKSDFDRILTNMQYIADMFEIDYSMPALPTIPRASYVQLLRDKVEMFRTVLPIHDSTPYTPNLPINTFKKMNDLEQILYDVHENLKYRFKYYCDDGLYMDCEIGTIE